MNLMKVLKLLVKTYANGCATLSSTMLRKKVRNIIDNNDDNDTVTNWSTGLSGGLVLKKAELRRASSCDSERTKFFFTFACARAE